VKKLDQELIGQIRDFALAHPEDSYKQIAATFDVSVISVKRYCSGLGRSKKWRTGRTSGSSDPQRFWEKVARKQPGDCWPWSGCLNGDGYGFLYWNSRNTAAHRLAFELMNGPIAEGMDIDHLCRRRACCNPAHLTPVTHKENLQRAGLIPRRDNSCSIDTRAQDIDTPRAIDTAEIGSLKCDYETLSPLIKDSSISLPALDTAPPLRPVSIQVPIVTPIPKKPDPFTAICVMQTPPEIKIPQHPPRQEGPTGTKADLGIDDWAETEFGALWWAQTDEQLRGNTVYQQTEAMRESGEFLHWYFVSPAEPNSNRTSMSARNGPEACVKVERCFGKGWAASWEYAQPDPHRGPFYEHRALLTTTCDVVMTVARTIPDAVAMIEEVWGPGAVLQCDRLTTRPTPDHLRSWSQNWRVYLKNAQENLEQRRNAPRKCA
jgi:hypothetical protein